MSSKILDNQTGASAFYKRRNMWEDYVSERKVLHPTHRLVGIWIARRINADGPRNMWYQVSTIGEKLDLSPRTIIRAVKALEKEGVLLVRRDRQRGKNTAVNQYELVFPWL